MTEWIEGNFKGLSGDRSDYSKTELKKKKKEGRDIRKLQSKEFNSFVPQSVGKHWEYGREVKTPKILCLTEFTFYWGRQVITNIHN